MQISPTGNKKVTASESSVHDEFQSPQNGHLNESISSLGEIFGSPTPSGNDGNASKDLEKSSARSKRLSENLEGRVSKFNANPTDAVFLSPMQLTAKKKIKSKKKKLAPPIEFSPAPRHKRAHPSKKLETKIKAYQGGNSSSDNLDLLSPKDVKKLIKSSKGNKKKLGEILDQYEKLAKRNPKKRIAVEKKKAAKERRRRSNSSVISDKKRKELLKKNRARMQRNSSQRILIEPEDSFEKKDSDEVRGCGNVWTAQSDFENFVPPSLPKTKTQRELILSVIERSLVFAEFRKYGKARCDGALDMLVDAFESVEFPSGHVLMKFGMIQNNEFYVVERGRVDFTLNERRTEEIDEVGGYFGELALLHGAPCGRTVTLNESSGKEVRLLKIDQTTFRGILNVCSKKAAQEKRDALLSVEFLADLIQENKKMITRLSSIMIREEMELDGAFSLSQKDTFVVIRSGRIQVSCSDNIFESGDHFGSQALIQTLPFSPSQKDIEMVAHSEKVVFFKIENSAMGQIIGESRLQNLMDMRQFANTEIIKDSNLSVDVHDIMADTIKQQIIGDGEETWEVDISDPPALYIVREGSLNVLGENSAGKKTETLVTMGSIFGLQQLKMLKNDGTPVYERIAGIKATIPIGESTSIGVLPLNKVKVPPTADSRNDQGNDVRTGGEDVIEAPTMDDIIEAPTMEWRQSPAFILEMRAKIQELVESKISLEDLEKIRLLGQGEFGEVWLVAANVLDGGSTAPKQNFALKSQFILDNTRGVDATDDILREIEIMRELNHPQITDLVTCYQDETSIHMLMRLVPYGELWDRIHIEQEDGNWVSGIPVDHAKFYTMSIADTLNFIHSKDVIYRDLKPENVLIDIDGYPVVVDFGCSRFCSDSDKAYTFVGTPKYVAPEMVTNAGHNRGVDIWALGVIAYEMVTGENPFFFEGVDDLSLYHSICKEEIFPIPEGLNTEDFVDFIDGLLEKDPVDRLGMLHAGMKDILDHEWLRDIPLSKIRNKSYPAPWKPTTIVRDGFEGFQKEESMKSYSSIQDSVASLPSVPLLDETAEIQKHSNSSHMSLPDDVPFSAESSSSDTSTRGASNRDVSNQDVSNRDISNRDISDRDISDRDISDRDISNRSIEEIENPDDTPKAKSEKTKKKSKDKEKSKKKTKSKDKDSKEKKKSKKKSKNKEESNESKVEEQEDEPFDDGRGSYRNQFNEPSTEPIKFVIRNPKVRQTTMQKRERQNRRDLLFSSLESIGVEGSEDFKKP